MAERTALSSPTPASSRQNWFGGTMAFILFLTCILGAFVLLWRREASQGFGLGPSLGVVPPLLWNPLSSAIIWLVGLMMQWWSAVTLLVFGWQWSLGALVVAYAMRRVLFRWFCGTDIEFARNLQAERSEEQRQKEKRLAPMSEQMGQRTTEDAPRLESDLFQGLHTEAAALETRCARVWNVGLEQRRKHRELRRVDPATAREILSKETPDASEDKTLVSDLDHFFDALCSLYLEVEGESPIEIRKLLDS